ncbi:hypothetical protein [Methanobrevibacter sp.]|uniref:hypothetical protein n=1 Tax=Methanobrevibacter sp. TaxID=66852 RepID=UPI003867F8AE
MKTIKQLKNPLIYLPCTPAHWTTEPEYKEITRIHLTAGGGMGGSSWNEYVEKIDNIESNKIQKFTRINGKQILLNTHYITDAENFTLITAAFYNENPNAYKIGENTVQYIVEDDIKGVRLVNAYGETI